jgi:uncharacterized protein
VSLKVGKLTAAPGEHVFGMLDVARSRSGLSPEIPVHLFAGVEDGPTFLVQATIHGNESVGNLALLRWVQHLDPKTLRGNVIAVPTVNRVGLELLERGSRIDGKDISRLYPGNPNGSVSDQVAHVYFNECITQATVMLDLHAGGRTGYERYVLFNADKEPGNPTEQERRRRTLVVAFGLEQAAFFPHGTFGEGAAKAAVDASGVLLFTVEFGGATGWFKNGEQNLRDLERGLWNTLKALRMIDGELEADGPLCTIYNAGVVIWKPPVDGLFIRKKAFGEHVKAGKAYGVLVDPYTGAVQAEMPTPRDSIVIPSGVEWPTIGSTSVGILGTIDEIVDRRTVDLHVSFDAVPGSRV